MNFIPLATNLFTPMIGETSGIILAYALVGVLALVGLWFGFGLCNWAGRMTGRAMERAKLDVSLRGFLQSMVTITLKVLVLITFAGMLGIQMTSFIALLGAAGLAVGMSLQGALSNFAGGVLILVLRPFRVGDYIQAQGHEGTVKLINIVNTELNTLDGKRVILPNGALANGDIVNFTAEDIRRVDLTFGIGYGDTIEKAREVMIGIANTHPKVLSDPAPFVGLLTLNDSSVDLTCRVWVKNSDYFTVFFDLNESVKNAFDSEAITIPYPHREVIMHTAND